MIRRDKDGKGGNKGGFNKRDNVKKKSSIEEKDENKKFLDMYPNMRSLYRKSYQKMQSKADKELDGIRGMGSRSF